MTKLSTKKNRGIDNKLPLNKLDSIQCCRAVAFVMVLMLHRPPTWAIFDILKYGRYGVMMFFIISGFIITYLHLNGKVESIRSFAIKRIIRLYPVYLISALMCVSASIYLNYIGFDGWAPVAMLGDIGWVSSFTLLPINDGYMINALAWSLVYEVWYYMFFGLTLYFMKGKFILGIVAYSIILLFVNIFKLPWVYSGFLFINWVVILSPMNFFFIIGACIAYIIYDQVGVYRKICWIIAMQCYLSIVFIGNAYTLEDIGGVLPETILLTFSLALIIGMLLLEKKGLVKFPRVLVYLGGGTYSLYLIHYIYLFLYESFAEALFVNVDKNSKVLVCIYYVTLLFIALLIYRYFEVPSSRYLRAKFLNKSK